MNIRNVTLNGRLMFLTVALLSAVSCGGAGQFDTGDDSTVLTDGIDDGSSGVSGSLPENGMPRPAEITLNLSDAHALLLQDGNSPAHPDGDKGDGQQGTGEGEAYGSDEEGSDENPPAGTDDVESAGDASETDGTDAVNGNLETNFWILDGEGNLLPGVTVTGGNGKKIEIERIDTSPTGETYLLFAHTVSVKGERCKWVMVGPAASQSAVCADPDTRFQFSQIKFGADGTAYYSSVKGLIKARERTDGQIRTLFSGADIDFVLEAFLPAPDGSIMIVGDLAGTSRRFFRLLPDADGVVMESQCLSGVKAKVKGFAPGNEMFMSSGGDLYVKSTQGACDELTGAKLYRGIFTDGALRFSPIPGVDSDFFAEDSEGGVYAVKVGRGGEVSTLTRVNGGLPGTPEIIPLASVESLRVIGDDVYATGIDGSGRNAFLRRNLLSDGDAEDLLQGRDLVVQDFQVNAAGDVYFDAVDYADAAGRKLFRYAAEGGLLKSVAALPEDLKEIIFMGTDESDPYGLEIL